MQTYLKKDHAPAPRGPAAARAPQDAPSMDALRTGTARPSPEQLGQQVDLPSQIQTKMERAFGMDFSGVQLYRSQAVADAGAQAVAQGRRIAFAPDRLDFSSQQGQSLLGHEFSHVASQARGEVRGRGFLENAALESRADQEGAMAARGESAGPATGTLSSASAMSASGPMQAKKPDKDKQPAPAIDAGVHERADPADHSNLTDAAETGIDLLGDVSDVLDGDTLSEGAGLLKKASDSSGFWGKAADQMEKLSKSDGIDTFGKVASAVGTGKALYDAGSDIHAAVTGTGEGDRFDQTSTAVQSSSDAIGSTLDTVSDYVSEGTGEILGNVGAVFQIGSGAVGTGKAIKKGVTAQTDDIAAQNTLRHINERREGRTSARQQRIDSVMTNLASSQQFAARVHKGEAGKEGVHSALDMGRGGANFIPGVGNVVSLGLGVVQKATDAAFDGKIKHDKKVARQANLGQEHMDLIGKLQEKLIAERKAECAAEGREFTMFDEDECIHQAKHTVNEAIHGEGNATYQAAALANTNQNMDMMEDIMQQRDDEAKAAVQDMTGLGHAVSAEGKFVDRAESATRFNADYNSRTYEEASSALRAKEDSKHHLVQVARANAQKKAQAKADKAAAKQAEKDRLAAMTPDARKAYKQQQKEQKKQDKAAAKAEKQAAKQRAKDEKARNAGARAEQKAARRNARKVYRNERAQYVESKMADPENQNLGLFGKIKKKHELKKEFDASGKAQGIENAPKGSASAGRGNPFKSALLHAKRSHDRVRDSIVNEGFEELGWADRAKIAVTNPLAWMASKTKSGKAKSRANLAKQASRKQRSADLLAEIRSAGQSPQPADPSELSFKDRVRHLNALQAGSQGAGEELIDQTADPSLLSHKDRIEHLNSGHAGEGVDPAKLSFQNKIKHLNSRLTGGPADQAPAAQVPAAADEDAGGELMDQTADPALLSVKDKVERYDTGTASNDGVDPALLPFKNKVKHLNSRLGGK